MSLGWQIGKTCLWAGRLARHVFGLADWQDMSLGWQIGKTCLWAGRLARHVFGLADWQDMSLGWQIGKTCVLCGCRVPGVHQRPDARGDQQPEDHGPHLRTLPISHLQVSLLPLLSCLVCMWGVRRAPPDAAHRFHPSSPTLKPSSSDSILAAELVVILAVMVLLKCVCVREKEGR